MVETVREGKTVVETHSANTLWDTGPFGALSQVLCGSKLALLGRWWQRGWQCPAPKCRRPWQFLYLDLSFVRDSPINIWLPFIRAFVDSITIVHYKELYQQWGISTFSLKRKLLGRKKNRSSPDIMGYIICPTKKLKKRGHKARLNQVPS